MPEHSDGHEYPAEGTPPDATESPPKPQDADVPPPSSALSEDQLDSVENLRRQPARNWRIDSILLSLYVLACLLLVAALVLIRRLFSYR